MKKIIYVEDDRDTAMACKEILEGAGYEVDLAFSGRQALEKVQQKDYLLALIDIMLPDMSGWEVFQKIKHPGMKCVFLTALSITQQRKAELKQAGVSDYITKPFTNDDLLERIKKILEH